MVTSDIAVRAEAVAENALAVWAEGARAVNALAEHVAQSALVPQQYRGKPVDVLACWLTGQELGIQPMAALRSIDVIQGTPALRAHAMRALVLSHGHEIEVVDSDDEHCVMRGRRKGSQTWQTVTWDLDRAKRLGLASRDQWKLQPRTMLIARATGEVSRLIAADALYAVPYTSEEVRDVDFADGPAQPARLTAADLVADAVPTQEPKPAKVNGRRQRPEKETPAEQPPAEPERNWPDVAQPPLDGGT